MARAGRIADELPVEVDVDALLGDRARRFGWVSRGRTSANGSCRLLPTADGWIAVNLPRPDDLDALPAVMEAPVDITDPWPTIASFAAARSARAVADRFQLFEVAAAVLDDPTVDGSHAVRTTRLAAGTPVVATPLVVDLSSMWAGPLCSHLLGRSGMRVVKVESVDRPDGLRVGDPDLFARLHDGHEHQVLDFASPDGRSALLDLLRRADVVVESSRPRALRQLGIDASQLVRERGCTWLSITGYGRTVDDGRRIAFGDDAAVAGGLVAYDHTGAPSFCADAIADPLTGLMAASAALRALESGGGLLLDVAMAEVSRSLLGS